MSALCLKLLSVSAAASLVRCPEGSFVTNCFYFFFLCFKCSLIWSDVQRFGCSAAQSCLPSPGQLRGPRGRPPSPGGLMPQREPVVTLHEGFLLINMSFWYLYELKSLWYVCFKPHKQVCLDKPTSVLLKMAIRMKKISWWIQEDSASWQSRRWGAKAHHPINLHNAAVGHGLIRPRLILGEEQF